jgi:ribosomal protein S18 acetylase RimI-like enzyme
MSIEIAEMTVTDYDEVVALWQSAEGVHVGNSDSRRGVGRYLAHNPGMSFVARDARRVVGTVLCGTDGRRGYLHHLAVAADRRREGIGTALIRRCLAALKQAGMPRCNLFVQAGNESAIAFYRSLGWYCWDEKDVKVMAFDVV